MSKTWLVTSAFCKSALLEDCLNHLGRIENHVVIDNHYPIDQIENSARIKQLAEERGCIYVDSGRDLGLHEGINNASRVCGFQHGDIVVGCDPDDRPSSGFVDIISTVMRADPSLAVLGLNFWVIPHRREQDPAPYTDEVIAGHRVMIRAGVEMWTVAGFNWSFVGSTGGMSQHYAYYGGLEASLYHKWHPLGLRLGYLTDVSAESKHVDRNDLKLFDPEYREWKTAHVGGFEGSFQDWLWRAGHGNQAKSG